MKAGQMPKKAHELRVFDLGNMDDYFHMDGDYPGFDIVDSRLGSLYTGILDVATAFTKPDHLNLEDWEEAEELRRIQTLYNEFGQKDPGFPPDFLIGLLKNGECHTAAHRIISWAITTNMTPDGDIRHTLLPARVVALLRDLDVQSESSSPRPLSDFVPIPPLFFSSLCYIHTPPTPNQAPRNTKS